MLIMPSPRGAAAKIPVAGGIGYAVNKKSLNVNLVVEFKKVLASPEVLQVFFADAGAVTAKTKMDTSAVTSPDAKVIFGWLGADTVPMALANAVGRIAPSKPIAAEQ